MDFNSVEIYEKKYTLEELYHMFMDNRLHFAKRAAAERHSDKRVLAELLDAIWMGIPVPDIYVSEMQNGDFAVLESDGKLHLLIAFLDGRTRADIYYEHTMLGNCDVHDLALEDRRYVSRLLDAPISLKVIDYRTPLYLHMQTGKIVGNWSVTTEQSIREIIYGRKTMEAMTDISRQTWKLMYSEHRLANRRVDCYRTLYMLMCWLVYKHGQDYHENMREQQLLEETLNVMQYEWDEVNDFLYAVDCYLRNFQEVLREHNFKGSSVARIIGDKGWGVLLCALDMGKYTGRSYTEIVDLLLKRRLLRRNVLILERTPFSKMDIEWVLNELSRSLNNDQYD